MQIDGGNTDSKQDVLNRLKYSAWKNCANGIINISNSYSVREEGELFDDDKAYYQSNNYSGIAVQIDIDEDFINKYGNGINLNFIKENTRLNAKEDSQDDYDASITILGILLCAVLVAVAALAPE